MFFKNEILLLMQKNHLNVVYCKNQNRSTNYQTSSYSFWKSILCDNIKSQCSFFKRFSFHECLCEYVYMHEGAYRGLRKTLNPLEFELQASRSHVVWVLGIRLRPWGRASTLDSGVFSMDPREDSESCSLGCVQSELYILGHMVWDSVLSLTMKRLYH